MAFESERKYRKTIVQYQSKFTPQEVWEYLVHPKHTISFTKDPCYHCEIPDDFVLNKGSSWTEIHTGEDCKGDVVETVIVDLKRYQSLSTIRHQAGIKNKSVFKLTENEAGTLISEEQIFSLSLKNISLLGIFAWIMLVAGILTRFALKPEDDLFWFEKMEEAIEKSV